LSEQGREIQTRLQQAQRLLREDQTRVARLADVVTRAVGEGAEMLRNELELAKAQVELGQDEVDDAHQDLVRAGGDPQDQIQRLVQEHEAMEHASAAQPPGTAAVAGGSWAGRGLAARARDWLALRRP